MNLGKPDCNIRNEIGFIVTDKHISLGSDHRMVEAKIESNLGKERSCSTKKDKLGQIQATMKNIWRIL